jgi:hypothetical protein
MLGSFGQSYIDSIYRVAGWSGRPALGLFRMVAANLPMGVIFAAC